ncbi:MAG: elongation factor Ts [Proteobacteria bacterium]|jgi:elongation factor Ts|nr:elongation factor Ts [Pseudomonadota bacterium]MBP10968.1 elongation factor Ts [Acidiferrobacteraceae bacterium]MDP6134673.1 translation elongation factor Ts [Arenicellales bacterium]HJP11345.1 translation elongation factor Ts [Arenicellales bacterium]|tara:strand:+ start:1036 stop:1914 length:879 start_codon:yes stop_codon:yes gene_type:complete
MAISAGLVKELRERTAAGMMACKKALIETEGDLERAVELLREIGAASVERRAERIATEGVVGQLVDKDGRRGVVVEVNCETDFVAKGESFREFVLNVANCVLDNEPATLESLAQLSLGTGTIESARQDLIAQIGENVSIRRFERLSADDGLVAGYLHGTRIGVLVSVEGEGTEIARDVAMHVAASKPLCISQEQMPAETLAREKSIFLAQARDSGKTDEIVQRMVDGRLDKFLKENTLLGQAYVKDPDISVGQLVDTAKVTVNEIVRFEVGEGLEKRKDDFVAEVMAQASQG